MKKYHGVCTPLSSLHTATSCGIGEILDLLPLIDWLKSVGFNALQLLPINDSGNDSSPYNALSTCAINPVYLSLQALPQSEKIDSLEPLKKLTASKTVDYLRVRSEKEAWLNRYFDKFEQQFLNHPKYQDYLKQNQWVATYARFVTLVKLNHYQHWQSWIKFDPDPLKIEREKIVQYLLFEQLKNVKKYADQHGVSLIGDLPILVSSQSVEVWTNQALFDLKNSVGVPPDVFSETGQSWGFPFFNWDIDRDGAFALWKQRLEYAENFYNFYRLDHIIGFFRLWKIPEGKEAKEGHFVPAEVTVACQKGKELLETIIPFSSMKPIGEDLGIILPEFRNVMKELQIPGIKVMRWERLWETTGEFISVEDYDLLNLVCVSTHDTETLTQWWNQFPQEASLYCKSKGLDYRPMDRQIRLEYLKDCHHANSQLHINLLNEYLALYPELVHDKPYEERINIPGTQHEENWRYRLRLPLEQITDHQGLKDTIPTLLA